MKKPSINILNQIATDPVLFGVTFLGWHAHPAQAEWLRNSTMPINWCRAGNRWGKTESIAIKHLWRCTFKDRSPRYSFDDPYQTVNTALSLDQASLPLVKAWRLLHKPAGENFRKAFIRRMVSTPFPRIEFLHGSIWWARSTIRKGVYLEGYDFDFATIDEAAFDPDLAHIMDQVLQLRLLDRGGQIDCISTGKRGSEFNRRFEIAASDPYQYQYQGKTTDNPNIDQDALKRVLSNLDPGLIEERIMGGERPSDGRIPYDNIARAIMIGEGLQPAKKNRRYSTGWDVTQESNFTVGVTIDITQHPYQLVAWEMFNQHTINTNNQESYWEYIDNRIRTRHEIYKGLTTIDATGIGKAVSDKLTDIDAEALIFTGQRLTELIGYLELAFGRGIIGIPPLSMELPNERTWHITNELEEVENKLSGLDTATALALALWGVRTEILDTYKIPLAPKIRGLSS